MIRKGLAALAVAVSLAAVAAAQAPVPTAGRAWMSTALSPDTRAELAVGRMTGDEKLRIVFGYFGTDFAPKNFEETATITLPERRLPAGWRPDGTAGRPAGQAARLWRSAATGH